MTRQRALIARILRTAGRHLNRRGDLSSGPAVHASIAVGTIYRNLRLMTECGELRRIETAAALSTMTPTRSPHGHLVCRICGRLEDVAVPFILLAPISAVGLPAKRNRITT